MTGIVYEREPCDMDRPCTQCGTKGTGYLTTRNGQDCVWCDSCGRYSHNMPRTSSGRAVRTVSRTSIPPGKRHRVLERDNYTCVLCHTADVSLHVGHLIGLDVGRREGLTDIELDDDENLAAMCDECNLGLSDTTVSIRFLVAALHARLRNVRERGGAA